MWFLLLQIFFLMLLAALAGALLTYWWMKNQFEDVTESYETLSSTIGNLSSQPVNALTRSDLEVGLSSINIPDIDLMPVHERLSGLEARLAAFNIPDPDFSPISHRLDQIETGMRRPNQDLEALHARLSNLEGSLSQVSAGMSGLTNLRNTNIQPLEQQLDALYTAVSGLRQPDMQPFAIRLQRLEETIGAFRVPPTDLSSLQGALSRVEQRLGQTDQATAKIDLDPVHKHLAQVEERLSHLGERLEGERESDMDRLTSDLEALSLLMEELRAPDLKPVIDRLQTIEDVLSSIRIPETDLNPLYQRLEVLRAQIAAPNKDLDALHTRFAGLENAISSIGYQGPDLTPMMSRLSGLEATVNAILTEVHNREDQSLAPIERRLASLQEAFLSMQQPDFSGLAETFHRGIDLRATEDRLTSIEYGLAAVHKMLRSRPVQDAPAPRQAPVQTSSWDMPDEPQIETRMETRSVPLVRSRPPRETDPIGNMRRPNDRANLLMRAAFGPADDLEQISGIGPMLRQLLNEIGVYYFWQIAEWSAQDVDWVDEKLEHFKGRIERDNWVDQARVLARRPGAAQRPIS